MAPASAPLGDEAVPAGLVGIGEDLCLTIGGHTAPLRGRPIALRRALNWVGPRWVFGRRA